MEFGISEEVTMKNSRKFLTIGCVVGFFLVAGLALAIIVFVSVQPPALISKMPLEAVPIMVTLSSPLNDAHYPVNTYIPARVTAIAREPIPSFTLELWVGGALVETLDIQPDSAGRATAEWQWVPAGEGEHTLLARARTSQGQIAVSNLVRVMITEPVAGNVRLPTEEGDTPESVAERVQVPVEQVQPAPWDEEAGMWSIVPPAPQPTDPGAPLAPGQPVWVPIVYMPPPSAVQYTPPSPPSGPTQPVESIDFGQIGISWGEVLFQQSPDTPPASPDLAASAQACDVNLFITDHAEAEKGFFVYRESPDGKTLQRIAVLAENGGALPLQFIDPGQQGRVTYIVAAFNLAGETPSNPVSVELDQGCSPAETGGLQLIGGTLILPEPVDQAYFYVSLDGRDWSRVPPQGFFAPEGDRVDIWDQIDVLKSPGPASKVVLTIEAWGWTGAELHALGALQTTTTTKEGDLPLGGDTVLITCERGTSCPPSSHGAGWVTEVTDGPEGIRVPYRDFEWQTSMPNDGVVWQVALSPFSSEYAENPPGLLASEDGYGGTEGYFQVDFEALFVSMPWEKVPFDVYVRVVPMAGGQPVGAPSNTVVIHYGAVGPTWTPLPPDHDQLADIYDISIDLFTDEQFADPGLWGCVMVEENYYVAVDYGKYDHDPYDPDCADPSKPTCRTSLSGIDALDCDLHPNAYGKCTFVKMPIYYAGAPACPTAWKPEEKSDVELILGGIWNAVTTSWDAVVQGIDWAKNQVVQGVVIALGEVGIDCTGKCEQYTRTLLDLVVAYFTGIPPNLPTADQVLEEGIRYAVDLALQEAGINCSEIEGVAEQNVCTKALEEARDEATKEMHEAYERANTASQQSPACGVSVEAAHAFGVEPFCVPADLKAKPIPEGTYRPATMTVSVTREGTTPISPGENEFRAIQVTLEVENWALADTFMRVSDATGSVSFPPGKPVRGEMFKSQIVPIPPLENGEKILIPLVLESSDYTFPGYLQKLQYLDYLGYQPGGPRVERAIQFSRTCLRKGGTMTVRAELMCKSTFMGKWESCGTDLDERQVIDLSNICDQFERVDR